MSEIKQEPTDFEYLIEENVSLMIYPVSARASEFLRRLSSRTRRLSQDEYLRKRSTRVCLRLYP